MVVDSVGEIHLLLEADTIVDGSSEQQRFAAAIAAGSRERSGSRASQVSKTSLVSRNSHRSNISKAGSDAPASVHKYGALGSRALCQVEDLDIAEGSSVFELEAATDPDGLGMQLMYCRARAFTSASMYSVLGWSETGGDVPNKRPSRFPLSPVLRSPAPRDARTTR
jgi:hypothetical protein